LPPRAPVAGCTWLSEAEAFARRDPVKAVACAFGTGLLLHLLPTRATTAVFSALVRPVLLCLGLIKVLEVCGCNKEPKV
jgi:hypothetical protein